MRMHVMLRHAARIATLVLGTALAMAAHAQDGNQTPQSADPLTLLSIQTHGDIKYLADGHGYPLYTLVPSEHHGVTGPGAAGESGHMKALPCGADCQAQWPPVTVAVADPSIKTIGVVDPALIGTSRLENGGYQLTFNGYPLYYNQRDLNAPNGAGGALAGQGVEAFGGSWYILHADTGAVFNPYDFNYDH